MAAFLAACAAGAWALQTAAGRAARRARAEAPAPSPVAEMLAAGLGGFRGLAAEFVWFRADRLQDEGRYGELAQLAGWLTFLEPHTPEVWAYSAWNLAYNVSVMLHAPEDRWRWVEAGIRLLRDDGLRLNPGDPTLHRELAWLFLFKLGTRLDSASDHYRAAWKKEVAAARAAGDWSALKMTPEAMAAVDAEYGAQDWTDPYASALYWAHQGFQRATTADGRHDLRQVLYQTLLMLSRADARFIARARREIETAYREHPTQQLRQLIESYRDK